jgi:hypothetical protein
MAITPIPKQRSHIICGCQKVVQTNFCLRIKAFNLNLSRICSLHKGGFVGKYRHYTFEREPPQRRAWGGGGGGSQNNPIFCSTFLITTFVLGTSFRFSFVQGFQSSGGATIGGVRPVSAPQTSEGAPTAGGFRSVGAPVTKPGTGLPPPVGPPLAAQPANCWVCGRTVSGVFLQVKGTEYGTKSVLKNDLNSFSHAQVIQLNDNVTNSTVMQLACTCPTVQIGLTVTMFIYYILH